jgi:hypothetical protein
VQYTRNAFLKCGAQLESIKTDEDYVKKLMMMFKKRGVKK